MRAVFRSLVLLLFALVQMADAECNGFIFTVKSDNTPIYAESKDSSAVVRKLSRGDKVCCVGQEGDFAILVEEAGVLRFAKYRDLYPPDRYGETAQRGLFQRVRDYYHFLAGGGVPEDPFYPLRPILKLLEEIGIWSSSGTGRKEDK